MSNKVALITGITGQDGTYLAEFLLYKRARAGEIKNYTGIDSPYEAPDNPELIIDTESESLEKSVAKVIDFLKSKEVIN